MEILELKIWSMLSTDDIGMKAEEIAEFDHLLQEQVFSKLQQVQFFFLCQFGLARRHLYGPPYSIENVMLAIT